MTACRRALGILLGVVVWVAVVATGATASAAQEDDEGLRAEATTTYQFDAAAGVVHVTVEANLRNTVPDQRDGNVIRQTYFTGFPFVVPLGAANFAATGDGESLTVAGFPIDGSDTISRVEVAFGNDLFYNESLAVVIAYDLTGEAPRSGGVSRINPAYASFEAYGVGDPGLSTVRVVIPSGFEVDSFGEVAAETVEGDNRVFTATGLDFGWYMLVSARNDDALVTTPGASADLSFEVRAWPGDEEWAQFVTDTVTAGVPVLSDLVGQPWPLDDTTLQVREAFTPYLYGYAGWFNALTGTIEVGEDLDQEVVLHELSHAWFNRDLFSDRWLNEGMAQTYAAAAITALGGTPDAPVAVDTEAPGATVLVDWNTPSDDETAGPQEEFGYNASWFVVDSLVDEIGLDAMKQLFAAADAGTIAYVGDSAAEAHGSAVGWRTFLDMAEELGGSTALEPVVRAHVATPGDHDVLDERIAARTEYDALDAAGGEWAPPLGVRENMADWDFADAHLGMQAAAAVLSSRDELTAAVEQLELTPPSGPESSYESVEGDSAEVAAEFSEVDRQLGEQVAAVGRIETLTVSVDDAMNEFAPDGLLTDLDAVLDPVRDAFEAGEIESVPGLADDAAATVADLVEAAKVVRAATAADGEDRDLFTRIGLLGRDLDGDLADARTALDRFDPETARRLAGNVDSQLDDARSVGQGRALASGASVWAVLALVTVVLVVRIRRRPVPAMAIAGTTSSGLAEVGTLRNAWPPPLPRDRMPGPSPVPQDQTGDLDSS